MNSSYPRIDLRYWSANSKGTRGRGTYKQTFPPAYMLGLNRHLPPFVVVAITDGAFPGYSEVCLAQCLLDKRPGPTSAKLHCKLGNAVKIAL